MPQTAAIYTDFRTIGLLIAVIFLSLSAGDLVSRCQDSCEDDLINSNVIDRDLTCETECKIDNCKYGCSLWQNTSLSSCTRACNETEQTDTVLKIQHCVLGCHFAVDLYAAEITDNIGEPTAPLLVHGSLNSTSLGLEWEEADHPEVLYLIQWKYQDIPSDWSYYQPDQLLNETSVQVADLHPYVTYVFRVIWVITSKHMLASPPSNPITTLPSGVPSSPPVITELSSPSHSTIHITWDPPTFINGPLTNYHLSLVEVLAEHHTQILADVSPTTHAYTFTLLKAETLYEIKVSAGNIDGHGPAAVENITTEAKPNATTDDADILGSMDMDLYTFPFLERVIPLPSTLETLPSSVIQGVGVHYWKDLLFYSDSDRNLFRKTGRDPNGVNDTDVIYSGDDVITAISVDWLYDKLYFVENDTIVRCDLVGDDAEIVIPELDPSPSDILVDPYNGFLYWTQIGEDHGLYRVDLADAEEAGGSTAELIVPHSNLAAIATDYSAFRVFYVNQSEDTFISAFVDGTDLVPIHDSIIEASRELEGVTGLVHYDDFFTWTVRKSELYTEELNTDTGQYSHTDIGFWLHFGDVDFNGLAISHATSQPYPVPVAPLTKLQALYTENSALVTWNKPQKLDFTGRGAWREWTYEIDVRNLETGNITIEGGITSTSHRVKGLDPDSEYDIQVRAGSPGGVGGWSPAFKGKTLQSAETSPYILVTNHTDIIRVAIDGSQQELLLSGMAEITDLDWREDTVYWSDEDSRVQFAKINDSDHDTRTVEDISTAEAIAVDWFSGILYWADKTQNVIWRASVKEDGSRSVSELVQSSSASDIAIDSVQAFIYWTTPSSVECARLSGDGYFIYQELESFTGEEVAGLTLNFDDSKVHWFVHSSSGLRVFQADLAHVSSDPTSTTEEIALINSYTMQPALHYYSDRLFWLNENHHVIVSTIRSESQATLMSSQFRTLSVIQSSLHPLPAGFDHLPVVVPNIIEADSIQVVGVWDNFQIQWPASNEVTFGTVWYEYLLTYDNERVSEIMTEPYHNLTSVPPFTEMEITLEAYTYWATSQRTVVRRTSPMSVPSIPNNARAFSKHDTDIYTSQKNISADVRWEMPDVINGILVGYHMYVATETNNTISWKNVTLGSDAVEHHMENLEPNSIYYITIAAFTEVGDGESTDTITIETEVENPPPTLLVLKSDGVDQLDLDNDDSMTVIDPSDPVFLGYISHESSLFWVNGRSGEIMESVDGQDIEVVAPSSVPVGFATNWIGRSLYWTETSNEEGSIHLYNLNTNEELQIQSRSNKVGQIVVDPYQSRLFWTEEFENNTVMMTSDLLGQNVQHFFSKSSRRKRNTVSACNCQSNLTVSQVIAIDQSDAYNPMLYFADADEGHLWRSDTTACQCQKLLDANSVARAGLPPDSLTVDHKSVYWTNTAEGVFNSIDKADGSNFQTRAILDVNNIFAYGDHLQPMPDISCLSPGRYTGIIEIASSTSDSLTLNLTSVTWPPQCDGISKASVTYTVHYASFDEGTGHILPCDEVVCETLASEDDRLVIDGLEPYTWYLLQASTSNYYTQDTPQLGEIKNYQTDPGVPSPVEGLNINIRTSYVANVTWLPPAEPNGPVDEIRYKVVYSSEVQPLWIVIDDKEIGETADGFYMYLSNLQEGTTYYFKVRAYPALGDDYSECEPVQNATFQEPNDVYLVVRTNTTFNVSWTSSSDNSVLRHSFKYLEPGETIWKTQTIPDAEKAGGNNTYYNVIGENVPLKPNTPYHVRVDVVYITHLNHEWLPDKTFPEFWTLAGVPDIPQRPYFEEIQSEDEFVVWQVKWDEPNDNGAPIFQYDLQYSRVVPDTNGTTDGNWTTVYNESETVWTISGLDSGVSYIFRVCAINDAGSSNYSQESTIFNSVRPYVPGELNLYLIIIIAVAAAIGLALIIVIVIVCITIGRNRRAKTADGAVHFDVDRELATLRNLPNTLIRESNAFYNVGNLALGDVDLPLFPREKLKLVTFLGSGAFGEVYEGVALDIMGDDAGETKVAVKTLRKGATDQEKEEFLKEAQLMSNFKHANILSLLGVCLDNDPQFIILELMEAGDLLSYLRSCRPTAASPATLGCLDLIEISIDVCKGCAYLEEMHFVHRDLAARNCLVSHRDPRFRNVKIGDFGLARDIYKNDYYRKEGEGLLPVRWMSPESLVDGVFTIQSDLWSFGVLLWEIMTLGQQPYPARTNLEVLHFVTSGGRLGRPDNCPDDIHQLMLKCWHEDPEGRPTFRYILQRLEMFKRKSLTMDGMDSVSFDAPVNYSKIRQQDVTQNSVEDEEGYLEPINSKQSLRSRESYRNELLSDSSGIGSGASLKQPTPKPSPLLGKKFPTSSAHTTPQGSPRLDGRRSGRFQALENAFDRDRTTHNSRYAMDVSVTPRSTPLATPRSTPTSSRKVLYHDNKAFLPDEDEDLVETLKEGMKSSLSKATGKGVVSRKDSGNKPSSLSKATGASLFGNKGVGRQSSLNKAAAPNSQPNSLSKATGKGTQPSSLSKATGQTVQPSSLSKATAANAIDTANQKDSTSKGTGASAAPANGVSNSVKKRHPNPFRKDETAVDSKDSQASGGARPYENVGKGGSTKPTNPKYENVQAKKNKTPTEQIVAII